MIKDEMVDAIEVKNVVILDLDSSGDLYMEKLFPYWIDVIVFTLEGKYPVNAKLRQKIINELENNENIVCYTFGAGADKYPMKTKKILRLAPFFYADFKMDKWTKSIFEFDEAKITILMKAFVGDTMSRLRPDRIQKYNPLIENVPQDTVKWFHSLIKS